MRDNPREPIPRELRARRLARRGVVGGVRARRRRRLVRREIGVREACGSPVSAARLRRRDRGPAIRRVRDRRGVTVSGSETGRVSFVKRGVAKAFAEYPRCESPATDGKKDASPHVSRDASSARKRLRCTSSARARGAPRHPACVPSQPARAHCRSTVSDAKNRAMSPWSSSGSGNPASDSGRSSESQRNGAVGGEVHVSHVTHVNVSVKAPSNWNVGLCAVETPFSRATAATSRDTASSVWHRNSCASCWSMPLYCWCRLCIASFSCTGFSDAVAEARVSGLSKREA